MSVPETTLPAPKPAVPTVSVQENLMWVRDRIRALAGAANRGPEAVRLIAVSKTVSIDVAHEAYAAGQRAFGENRVLELEEKAPRLPADCEWHMIGHLQKNKVRSIVRHAAWIHSVDSVALLQRIDGIAAEEGRCPRVLVQVNIDDETSEHVLKLLTELKSSGATILVATHDAHFEKIADVVYKMKNGRIE